MQKFIILSTLVLFLTSCSNNGQTKNHFILTTSFYPAFMEYSSITYSADKKNQYLSILISCYPENCDQDTFYYAKKSLTDNNVGLLDSTLLKITSIPIVDKDGMAFDGMTVNFSLVKDGDSTNRHFFTPGKRNNPFGYLLTSKAISNFKTIFNDPLVSAYFDSIHGYIDDSTFTFTSKDSTINKLRREKYGS